jgi:2',3'-cyclic-nucleotide 2'-phosphodiesterase (5'-nucleotidase family)
VRSLQTVAAALALLLLQAGAAWAETVRLTFIHVNDVYEILPTKDGGGLAEMAAAVRTERDRAQHSLFTLGGDLISPSLISGITQGAHMIELMNLSGLDVAVLGNHEFDFGPDVLRRRIAESHFPWLASNVLEPNGSPFGGGIATWWQEMGGVKVAFLGVLTEATGHLSAGAREARFLPAEDTAVRLAAELKRQGAEVVVALTHQDLAEDRRLALKAKDIDLILGGHEHDAYTVMEGGALILKAGHDAQFLAITDLEVVREAGKSTVRPADWRIVTTRGVTPDARVADAVARWQSNLDADLHRRIATLRGVLDSTQPGIRRQESSMADLVADALREALGADVALINGGGLRGNRRYEEGQDLTLGDLRREMPFNNVGMLLEVSGADLLAALENGLSQLPDPAGRFPQVSGLTFRYDPAKPAGKRVVSASVGGRYIDPEGRYRLATNDYLADGGDGYTMFKSAKRLISAEAATLMVSLVVDRVAAMGQVKGGVDGRIEAAR